MRPYCIRCRGSVETSEPNFPADRCPGCNTLYIGDTLVRAWDKGDEATKLITLAVKMREAQKEYFKTRRGDVLADSKRLEREFDKAADAFLNPPIPDLFDGN